MTMQLLIDGADRDMLAKAFSERVRREFGPVVLGEINRRNATAKTDYMSPYHCACATQDFADANMLMHEAFVATFGREPTSEGQQADRDVWLWNEAWSAAKAARFGAAE
jgi:hypothetical protein